MRNLTIEGKITIFKCLVIKQILYLALLTRIPNFVIRQMKQIQKRFLQGNKNHKTMFDSRCDKYKDGGLKNVDMIHKVFSSKCSWVRRFCNKIYLDWKFISYITLRIIRQII